MTSKRANQYRTKCSLERASAQPRLSERAEVLIAGVTVRGSACGESKCLAKIVHMLIAAAVLVGMPVPAAPGTGSADGVAVIIGNRAYTDDRVPDVPYAHRDADAFRRYLIDVHGFGDDDIIDLRDASQAQLIATFGNHLGVQGSRMWRSVDPEGGSDIVVYYSGHGVPGLMDKKGYLLPVDANPDTAQLNGYQIDLLYANLGRLPAASVRVYLDACFSGISDAGSLIGSTSPVFVTPDLPVGAGVSMAVLTAASGGEVASWDNAAKYGLFTHHLLDGLYGQADSDGDGSVTAVEAKQHLDRHMTSAARRTYGRVQRASLVGEAAEVLSFAPPGGFPQRPVLEIPAELNRSFTVETTPSHARVQILDGPRYEPGMRLPPGKYRLEVTAAGYRRATRLVSHGALDSTSQRVVLRRVTVDDLKRRLRREPSSTAVDEHNGWTDLHYAAALDLPELARGLLADGMPADIRLTDNSCPLGPNLKRTLHDLGADLSSWGSTGDTPLHIAADQDARHVAAVLIEHGADVDAIGGGQPPLSAAAIKDSMRVAQLLIDEGADVDIGEPLSYAVQEGSTGVAALLLRKGAATPPDIVPTAVRRSSGDMVRLLIENGADVNGWETGWSPNTTALHFVPRHQGDRVGVARLLIESGAEVNLGRSRGIHTPLHAAAESDDVELVELLLDHGADASAKDQHGVTPLLSTYVPAVVRLLLDHGAQPQGWTPLHAAAGDNDARRAVALVRQGANVNAARADGGRRAPAVACRRV